jgi:hypothetical protein
LAPNVGDDDDDGTMCASAPAATGDSLSFGRDSYSITLTERPTHATSPELRREGGSRAGSALYDTHKHAAQPHVRAAITTLRWCGGKRECMRRGPRGARSSPTRGCRRRNTTRSPSVGSVSELRCRNKREARPRAAVARGRVCVSPAYTLHSARRRCCPCDLQWRTDRTCTIVLAPAAKKRAGTRYLASSSLS